MPTAPGYFERIREICTANDILLIADEIMCGSGRTGEFFAHRYFNVSPDLLTLAKGVGGGYQPLAAVVLSGAVAPPLISQQSDIEEGISRLSKAIERVLEGGSVR